jgi:hypothetical protein
VSRVCDEKNKIKIINKVDHVIYKEFDSDEAINFLKR